MIPHSASVQRADDQTADQQPRGLVTPSRGAVRRGGYGAGGRTLALRITAFNETCPVGTAGHLLRDNGQAVPTIVESPAHLLGGHIAVARFQGLRGFFSIERFIKEEGNSEQ